MTRRGALAPRRLVCWDLKPVDSGTLDGDDKRLDAARPVDHEIGRYRVSWINSTTSSSGATSLKSLGNGTVCTITWAHFGIGVALTETPWVMMLTTQPGT
jgi:hypothetical protein